MLKRLLLTLALGLILISGCAYFNTFYNAKRAYQKGQEATRKQKNPERGTGGKQEYDKAIAKSQKILDNYPESRWVDDALLLMGKSFYQQQQYYPALRQLDRLKREYPQSDLLGETDLYRAKAYLAISQFDSTETTLNRLISGGDHDILANVYMAMGQLEETRGQFHLAADKYRAAIDKGLNPDPYRGHIALAMVLDTLGLYPDAAAAYTAVRESDASSEWKTWARLRYARTLYRQGLYDQSVNYLESMLGSDRFKSIFARIKLEIAKILAKSGQPEAAIMAFQDLILDHPKTNESAEANYNLGNLYLYQKFDHERALQSYHDAAETGKQITAVDTAKIKKRDIQRMIALRGVIDMGDRGETGTYSVNKMIVAADTLGHHADSLRTRVRVDSLMAVGYSEIQAAEYLEEEKREIQLLREEEAAGDPEAMKALQEEKELEAKKNEAIIENPELKSFKAEEKDKNLFLLAELYFINFNQPDSAANQYLRIIDELPHSPYHVRAMHNYVYLLEATGNAEAGLEWRQRLAEQYPDSPYRYSAVNVAEDNAPWQLLQEAERTLFDEQETQQAYNQYRVIVDEHGEAEAAVSALFAMAWIAETQWDSLSLAKAHYDSLRYWYPDSPQALVAVAKVEAAEKGLPKPVAPIEAVSAADSTVAENALVTADSLVTALQSPDSAAVMVPPVEAVTSADTVATVDKDAGAAYRNQLSRKRINRMEERSDRRQKEKIRNRLQPVGGMPAVLQLLEGVYPKEGRPKDLQKLEFELQLKEDGSVVSAECLTDIKDDKKSAELLKMIKSVKFNPRGILPGGKQSFVIPLGLMF